VAARRLPWIKLWTESRAHEKVALLSDAQFRTWIYVLLAGAEQPKRWRFSSAQHASAVTGRPLAHIKHLVSVRLIDERDDGLWIHDYRQWQEVYESDLPSQGNGQRSANAPPRLRQDSANAPPLLREHPAEKGDGRRGDMRPEMKKYARVFELIQVAGAPIHRNDQDEKAVERCDASAELIAQAYVACSEGTWPGSDWIRASLSLQKVVANLAGYEASRKPLRPRRKAAVGYVQLPGDPKRFDQYRKADEENRKQEAARDRLDEFLEKLRNHLVSAISATDRVAVAAEFKLTVSELEDVQRLISTAEDSGAANGAMKEFFTGRILPPWWSPPGANLSQPEQVR
jgi:hypothetical protein